MQTDFIDLHTHTKYSDGGLTPTQLVQKAKDYGLKAIAVTDHDIVTGLDEAISIGEQIGVEVIPGVEFTAHEDSATEYHFLGYFIDYKNPEFLASLQYYQDERTKSSRAAVLALNNLGYKIDWEKVVATASGLIIKPHIAYVAIENPDNEERINADFGAKPTTGEFIQKYLVPGGAAYQERKAATPKEAIDLIHKIGGVVSLAHPCWDIVKVVGGQYTFADEKIFRLKNMGLEALEVLAHRDEEGVTRVCVDHFQKVAEDLKLTITGGSDYHGFGSGGKDLGFRDFYLKVPYQILEELRK